jgi:hypothetical protein
MDRASHANRTRIAFADGVGSPTPRCGSIEADVDIARDQTGHAPSLPRAGSRSAAAVAANFRHPTTTPDAPSRLKRCDAGPRLAPNGVTAPRSDRRSH